MHGGLRQAELVPEESIHKHRGIDSAQTDATIFLRSSIQTGLAFNLAETRPLQSVGKGSLS